MRKRVLGVDKLRGSIPPLATPLSNGKIDERAYARLVDFQITQGSHGVLVNGTTSEPSTLTLAERNRLVDVAVETSRRRVPVIAGTGSQSLAETQALTTHAARAGVDALLVVTPYYVRPPQRGLIEFFLEVTKHHQTPWMVYHIPGRTAVGVTIETLATLRDRSKTFVGIKHASNDLGFVSECMMRFGPDFRVFVGLEELSFPMMTLGACGLMNAVGNILPRPLAELCEAVWRGDLAEARSIHEWLSELNKAVFIDTNPIPIKYMMKMVGLLRDNEHRLPMSPATPDVAKQLDDVLRHYGLLDKDGKAAQGASLERCGRSPRKAMSLSDSS
jgi:4-hydroxy-tetrahydrodipicolinate synthase